MQTKTRDPKRCQESVPDRAGWGSAQCTRRWTVEDNGKWCKQHSPAATRNRRKESEERFNAETRRRAAPYEEIKRLRVINKALLEALEQLISIAGCSHFEGQTPQCEYCKARAAIAQARDTRVTSPEQVRD